MRNVWTSALWSALLLVAVGTGATPALAGEADFLYDPGTVNVIEMSLSPTAIEGLEDDPFEYQQGGTVVLTPTDGTPGGEEAEHARTFENVEIKLKGQLQGSFESLAGKAAFKLKFKKAEPFFGLRKLTLNNMTQDASMIHESLAYAAFGAAGVPASRSGYAYVWLNGENYGLHLDLESLDTVSLPRIFGTAFDDETQHLFEAAEYGADFYPGKESRFEVDEGADDTSDLTALIAAVDVAAPNPLPAGLSTLVDLDEMTRMWAVEKYIGHWDGYAGEGIDGEMEFNEHRPNNYYLYSDPSGRFSMLPWGADQTWDRRLEFDEQDGRLFDLCLEDESCAGKFSAAVAAALVEVGGLDLDSRASATAAMLKPWQALEAAPRKPFSEGQIASAVGRARKFIAERPAEAEEWLAAHPPPVPPTPTPPVSPGAGAGATVGAGEGAATPAPRLTVDRIHIVDGALRTQLFLPGSGIASQRVTIPGRRRSQAVCGTRLEVDAARFATLRCSLSDDARSRLRRRWLRVSVTTSFRATGLTPEGDTRQIVLPRDRASSLPRMSTSYRLRMGWGTG